MPVYLKLAPAVMVEIVGLGAGDDHLRRMLKPQLVAVFSGAVAVAIAITGYLSN